jgi:GT2 family glycosyltransferase
VVTIVIPNFNGRELLDRFLPSVVAAAGAVSPPAHILIIDDASTDDSVDLVRRQSAVVKLLVNDRNLGFGATANRGVEAAEAPLVLLLNTDVEVNRDAVPPLAALMRERTRAAAVVPRIIQTGEEGGCESVVFGAFRRGLFRIERRPDLCDSDSPLPVLYPCAAAVMLRRREFLALGGFDALFAPFYWEDVDLGYRMWRAGYEVLYEPRSRVLHHHPGSVRTTQSERRVRLFQDRNRFLFMWKNLDRSLLAQHFALLPSHLAVSALTGRGRFVAAASSALCVLRVALRSRRRLGGPLRSTREILERVRPQDGRQDAGR